MRSTTIERCDFCSERAVAYQNGATVCGKCGVRRTFGHDVTTSKRIGLIGLLSSGLLAKAMLGSVALAAVGGWAATSALSQPPGSQTPPPVPVERISEDTLRNTIVELSPALDEVLTTAQDQVEKAHDLAEASQTWADCVSDLAAAHRGGPFDPKSACGERPTPSDFGLGNGRGSTDIAATNSERKVKPEKGQNGRAPGLGNRPPDDPVTGSDDDRSDNNENSQNDNGKPDQDDD